MNIRATRSSTCLCPLSRLLVRRIGFRHTLSRRARLGLLHLVFVSLERSCTLGSLDVCLISLLLLLCLVLPGLAPCICHRLPHLGGLPCNWAHILSTQQSLDLLPLLV